MKKLALILLAAALCLLFACGEAVPEETSPAGTTLPITTQAPTTIEAPATIPIEYPAAYRDAPAAYKPVLDACYYQAQYGGGEWDIDEVYIVEPWFFDMDDLGYAVKDINNRSGQPRC